MNRSSFTKLRPLEVYNPQQTWHWNLERAPRFRDLSDPPSSSPVRGAWSWCGLSVESPLGISAGPLLNSHWLLHYADRGFDILVYKTVRTVGRDCYSLPNLVPVATGQLSVAGTSVPETVSMHDSWAVSFGMPSQTPDAWRSDIAFARANLARGKVLVVSVVGTQEESIAAGPASVEALANDFAKCAHWAIESGAHGVEANFSCPNVSTSDGQLYQQPAAAGLVAERIRDRIGTVPLVLKIGRIMTSAEAVELLNHVGPYINGLAMTNSIAAKVTGLNGESLFNGQSRGICGAAIRSASTDQVRMFRELLSRSDRSIDIIGVGGISAAEHVTSYLSAGATSVALATAAMLNPNVGTEIRKEL